jgi:putative intracellular protease/amidase
MTKTILFTLLDQYADWESAYLSTALTEFSKGKIEIKTVSISTAPIKTIGGFTTVPDFNLQTCPDDIYGLILIGGKLWQSAEAKALLPLVENAYQKKIVIGAICGASEFLGAFGFLNNVKHTSNGLDSILSWDNNRYNNAENYINEQSIRDQNIVTANGTASLDFAKDVLYALELFDAQKIEEWYAFHKIGYIEIMKNFS